MTWLVKLSCKQGIGVHLNEACPRNFLILTFEVSSVTETTTATRTTVLRLQRSPHPQCGVQHGLHWIDGSGDGNAHRDEHKHHHDHRA